MSRKNRRQRRSFTPEFKAEAVALAQRSEKPISQIAKELDLTETALRAWIKHDEDQRAGRGEPLGASERAELLQLRKDLLRVTMERDFLKKAAAFFAKESR
jgi:transposase